MYTTVYIVHPNSGCSKSFYAVLRLQRFVLVSAGCGSRYCKPYDGVSKDGMIVDALKLSRRLLS